MLISLFQCYEEENNSGSKRKSDNHTDFFLFISNLIYFWPFCFLLFAYFLDFTSFSSNCWRCICSCGSLSDEISSWWKSGHSVKKQEGWHKVFIFRILICAINTSVIWRSQHFVIDKNSNLPNWAKINWVIHIGNHWALGLIKEEGSRWPYTKSFEYLLHDCKL